MCVVAVQLILTFSIAFLPICLLWSKCPYFNNY